MLALDQGKISDLAALVLNWGILAQRKIGAPPDATGTHRPPRNRRDIRTPLDADLSFLSSVESPLQALVP